MTLVKGPDALPNVVSSVGYYFPHARFLQCFISTVFSCEVWCWHISPHANNLVNTNLTKCPIVLKWVIRINFKFSLISSCFDQEVFGLLSEKNEWVDWNGRTVIRGSLFCIDLRDDHVRQNKYVYKFISGELAGKVNVAKDPKILTIFLKG